MATLVTSPARLPDFADTAGTLRSGHWLAYPYEAYGQLDRAEWNGELVAYLAECGVYAEVIDIPRKSVVVVVNAAALPTLEQLVESVAAVEYQRAMGRH